MNFYQDIHNFVECESLLQERKVEPIYRECFIEDMSLQRTLFLRVEKIMVIFIQISPFMVDRNSGHSPIFDKIFWKQYLKGRRFHKRIFLRNINASISISMVLEKVIQRNMPLLR